MCNQNNINNQNEVDDKNNEARINVKYYPSGGKPPYYVGGITFKTDDPNSTFPINAIDEIGFPENMNVGDEVVISAFTLKKGNEPIKVTYYSDSIEVIGNCMVKPNTFIFPKRNEKTYWLLKFIAKKEGRIVPYLSFQRMSKSKIRIIGIVFGAILGTLSPIIIAVQKGNELFSGSTTLSTVITFSLVIAASSFWEKIESFTIKWETASNTPDKINEEDNGVKATTFTPIRIDRRHVN